MAKTYDFLLIVEKFKFIRYFCKGAEYGYFGENALGINTPVQKNALLHRRVFVSSFVKSILLV